MVYNPSMGCSDSKTLRMMKKSVANVFVQEVATDRLAAARAAAALKREKKAAAAAARIQGKIAAQEAREKMAEVERMEMLNQEETIQAKIARVRKALGVRKNEENPAALCRLIEEWRMQASIRRYVVYKNDSSW